MEATLACRDPQRPPAVLGNGGPVARPAVGGSPRRLASIGCAPRASSPSRCLAPPPAGPPGGWTTPAAQGAVTAVQTQLAFPAEPSGVAVPAVPPAGAVPWAPAMPSEPSGGAAVVAEPSKTQRCPRRRSRRQRCRRIRGGQRCRRMTIALGRLDEIARKGNQDRRIQLRPARLAPAPQSKRSHVAAATLTNPPTLAASSGASRAAAAVVGCPAVRPAVGQRHR